MKQPAVYILANKFNGTIYTGMTTNLIRRIWCHKNEVVESFTKKYSCKNLVFYEIFDTIEEAVTREMQLKKSSRQRKINLINQFNPTWKDLYNEICR